MFNQKHIKILPQVRKSLRTAVVALSPKAKSYLAQVLLGDHPIRFISNQSLLPDCCKGLDSPTIQDWQLKEIRLGIRQDIDTNYDKAIFDNYNL